MTPSDFFRSHGLIVDQPIDDGRWHRVATADKPKRKNGAYLLDGQKAVCQNWATMTAPAAMRPDETVRSLTDADRAAAARRRREREDTQERQWERAALRAKTLVSTCRPGTHGYPMRKGFPDENVLVTPDAEMVIPMRSLRGELMGTQTIRWLADERRWEKKFAGGCRARGAVFRFGSKSSSEVLLCEGWATGRSLIEAIDSLRLSMSVLVCFSAGNVATLANMLPGSRVLIFADNDPVETDPDKIAKGNLGGAGRRMAEATGLPWTMAPTPGMDANDHHQKHGLRALAGMLMDLRRRKA